MTPRYIEVAVGRLERLFHYRIPETLNPMSLQPGARLVVPFGHRVAIAYFIRFIDQPSVSETKDVQAVLDNRLPLPLIKLLQWISKYYCAPFGAVLQLALPKEDIIDRRFALTEEAQSALASGAVEGIEAQILIFLKKGPKTAASLRRKYGKSFMAVLSPLKRKGWIKQHWTPAPSANETAPMATANGSRTYVVAGTQTSGEDQVKRYQLNADQQAVLDQIGKAMNSDLFSPFLLHGVTGSGKTEVYMHLIEKALLKNKGAIVLVPEIGLTPQLAARFHSRFGKTVALLHSGLSPSMRHEAWVRIKKKEARIAIGARSALFAPMDDIGVIIVDEEHDSSYKQEEGVRYHARDTALFYGKILNAVVVLGSATPSMESIYNGIFGKYQTVSLPKRVSNRPLPIISIVDLSSRDTWVRPFLTRHLITAIETRLAQKEQVILFVNRRGHCPTLLCGDCGHKWLCKNCSVSLSFHKKIKTMLCHYCGYRLAPPAICPTCQGTRLLYLGVGTERVEEEMKTLFPFARVLRMDRDTTLNVASQHKIVTAMEEGTADILIGTQMVAKGHDFPNVTLVGVVCADLSFNLPDFRASERAFQLLAQVAGRSGRGEHPGEVLIQTFQPEQPLLHLLPDTSAFYDMETVYRKETGYPPYNRLILLRVSHRKESEAADQAEQLVSFLKKSIRKEGGFADSIVLGPAPAPLTRLRKDYRYQILLKGGDQVKLRALLNKGIDAISSRDPKGIRLIVDVDPQS